MEMDRKVLSRIKEILKANPRGMNVTEVAGMVKMNRQSVAKYLEMLVISGHVDVRSFGPSKVYYLSQRMPISAMLSLSYDFVILLDKQLKVLNVNDKFLELTGAKRDDILYKSVDHLAFPIQFEPSIMPNIREALQGSESAIEAYYKKMGRESFYNIKFIPMVLDDGEKGITIIFEDITKKKRIEDAIRESEEKFRSVIEQSMDGITLVDPDGIVTEFSRGLNELTGYAREDIIGKHLWELPFYAQLFQGDDSAIAVQKQRIIEYIESDELPAKIISERSFLSRDGKSRYVQVNTFKIRTGKGNMLCAIVRDITDRKRIEDAIRESEEKFRSVIEQSNDGIILSDEQGIITKYNGAMERITGVGRDEVLGKKMWDFHKIILKNSPKSKGRIQDLPDRIDTYLKTGRPSHINRIIEVEISPPGMGTRTVQVSLYNIKTEKGIIACSSIRDVTEFKRAETELRESRQRSVILAEAAGGPIYIIGRDLRIEYLNQSSADMIGKSAADLIGQPVQVMFRDETYEHVKKNLQKVVETGESMSIEHMIESDGRQYWMSVILSPIMESDGDKALVKSVVGITRDITARKEMEEKLRNARDDLELRIQERTRELEDANKALRKSEEKYRSLVENVSDGVWETDGRLRFTYMSPKMWNFLGLDPEGVLGKTPYDLMPPEEAARVKKMMLPFSKAKKSFTLLECELAHTDGRRVAVEISGDPILGERGELRGYRGVTRDISLRKKL